VPVLSFRLKLLWEIINSFSFPVQYAKSMIVRLFYYEKSMSDTRTHYRKDQVMGCLIFPRIKKNYD